MRPLRKETLAELVDLTEAEVRYPTEMTCWTDESWAITPPGGGWSVQHVLEHIKETERRYLDAIRAARRTANRRRSYRQVGHTPSYRQDWMKRYLHISHVPLKEGVLLQPLL
jgi:hypothetical protein